MLKLGDVFVKHLQLGIHLGFRDVRDWTILSHANEELLVSGFTVEHQVQVAHLVPRSGT